MYEYMEKNVYEGYCDKLQSLKPWRIFFYTSGIIAGILMREEHRMGLEKPNPASTGTGGFAVVWSEYDW